MRAVLTADLHYNHGRSTALADDVIDRISSAGGDVLVVVGDTAVADGDWLERCLSRFTWRGPKLFVAGNHELWTQREDSHKIFVDELPRRVRELGWHWLENEPFVAGEVAIVGSVGWYDFAFAHPELGIPRRFYEAKVSPGAAEYFKNAELLADLPIDHPSRRIIARWNDGKFVKLHRGDEAFLDECLDGLRRSLTTTATAKRVTAAVHHLPFAELLPPPRRPTWDFVHAYLGSPRIGELLLADERVTDVFCGHSHFPARAQVGRINAVNIGSGYRWKTFETIDL